MRYSPIWVDGVKFDSIDEACEKFNFRRKSFCINIKTGNFGDHVVTKYPPSTKVEDVLKSNKYKTGGTLLSKNRCVHRLGTYS